MPRNPRGGDRQLAPGAVSATRTDMNARQAPVAPVGLTYGTGVASLASQSAVPVPLSDQIPPAGASAPTAPPPADPAAAAVAPTAVRQLPPDPLDPTRRPNEPVTTGIDLGPGAGAPTQAPDIGRLGTYLPTLEVLANQPGTTQEMRNFVRLVRANMPTGA